MSWHQVQAESSGRAVRPIGRPLFAWLLASLALLPAGAAADYGHIRSLVGQADLWPGGTTPTVEAAVNYPVQVGDRLLVSTGGRLEVVLPDTSRLRLGSNTDLKLERLASTETRDEQNALVLLQGQIVVSTVASLADPRSFRVDTANASVLMAGPGAYRIFADGRSWTQVIVREGLATLITERDETRLGPGQEALVDGQRSPRTTVQAASGVNDLEQWSTALDAENRSAEAMIPYRRGMLPSRLSYGAAPLHRHGRWLSYRGAHVWRPHVGFGWRPYHAGWWIHTPAGMTWVSTEPWGWVPYHYGYWGFAGGIGWVWYPGDYYTPGAVYWYWGPTHVGWIPRGYYSTPHFPPYLALPPYGCSWGIHEFANRGASGFHEHTGGSTDPWSDWTFSPHDRFGYRDNHRHLATGAELRRRGVFEEQPPTGTVTLETGDLTPDLWREPDRVQAILGRERSPERGASRLSPLGAAALSGTSSAPTYRPSTSPPRTGGLVRQWDPDLWRQDQRTSSRPVVPYRRDSRSATSTRSGSPGSPLGVRGTPPLSGVSSPLRGSGRPGYRAPSRPAAPGISSRGVRGSIKPSPGAAMRPGPTPRVGGSSSARPSRPNGSGGRAMGGGNRGSTSRPDGSG